MKLAVLADIHANLPALEAVLAEIEREKVDGYIVAGDYLVGPEANETLRLIRDLSPAWIIRGNAEDNAIAFTRQRVPDGWNTSKQFALVRWVYSHIDETSWDYIHSLPTQAVCALPGAAAIRIVHGSPRSSFASLYPDADPVKMALFRRAGFPWEELEPVTCRTALTEIDERFLVCGHTHISWQQVEDGKLALNPGAVSGAAEYDGLAHFALLQWDAGTWQVKHRAVSYDVERLRAAFRDSGYLDSGVLARCFLRACETGQIVTWFFKEHVKRLAAAAGYRDSEIFPDKIWDVAEATFDWGKY